MLDYKMNKNVMLFVAFLLGMIVFKMMSNKSSSCCGSGECTGCKDCKGCIGGHSGHVGY